jgi:hypothetical protein
MASTFGAWQAGDHMVGLHARMFIRNCPANGLLSPMAA